MYPAVNSSGDAAECDQEEAPVFSERFRREQLEIEARFLRCSKDQQISLVQSLLRHMSHYQHGQIDCYLKPMLQRDFITDLPGKGLFQVSEQILSYLDAKSLCAANQVSHSWRLVIREGYLWKKLIERMVATEPLWRGLGERCGWIGKLRVPGRHIHPIQPRGGRIFKSGSDSSGIYLSSSLSGLLAPVSPGAGSPGAAASAQGAAVDALYHHMSAASQYGAETSVIPGYELMDPEFYRRLYPDIIVNIKRIQKNWLTGKYNLKKIECHSESSKGVYCLQYDDKKIVSGLRDNSIKVWDARTLECVRILTGHVGSVLCLQYDNNVIISGSSDSTVRVWSLSSWTCVNTIYHHCEAVLHLRFAHSILVTCSKDRSIAVWDMFAPSDIRLRRVLVGHRAAVNVVDFDQKNIVSASGDRTIKVWNTQSCEFLHTMNGHRRGIACLQYRNNLVVSGSSDNTIRLWQIETGTCLRTLEGHEELVRCIRFDSKYIVSGAYDGKIKVWDLVAALNPQSPANSLCLQTLNQHTGRVFRLQFDEFQIVSSSHDDTILIWDFLDTTTSAAGINNTGAVMGTNNTNNNNQDGASSSAVNGLMVRSPVISLDNDDNDSSPSPAPVVPVTPIASVSPDGMARPMSGSCDHLSQQHNHHSHLQQHQLSSLSVSCHGSTNTRHTSLALLDFAHHNLRHNSLHGYNPDIDYCLLTPGTGPGPAAVMAMSATSTTSSCGLSVAANNSDSLIIDHTGPSLSPLPPSSTVNHNTISRQRARHTVPVPTGRSAARPFLTDTATSTVDTRHTPPDSGPPLELVLLDRAAPHHHNHLSIKPSRRFS